MFSEELMYLKIVLLLFSSPAIYFSPIQLRVKIFEGSTPQVGYVSFDVIATHASSMF